MANNILHGNMPPNYTVILDDIMEKWLGPDFNPPSLHNNHGNSEPYRMLALLLDDPWNETRDFTIGSERHFIVDITKPEICRKLDLLNGPYFNTVMKMLELRMFDEDSERNHAGAENSVGTLV